MGEAAHADQCTCGQVSLKVLKTLVTYTMVCVYVSCESGRFDYVREISADGAQRTADVLGAIDRKRIPAIDQESKPVKKAGPTHEAFNLASARRLPVIFIIQNNQIALGTPVGEHHRGGDFSEVHRAYGCPGGSFDGNNVLDAYATTRIAARTCRAGDGPVILSAETFRMGGHATHDEQEARSLLPAELFTHWGRRDPIGMYEEYLTGAGVERAVLERVEAEVTDEVDRAADEALASRRTNMPPPESALDDVYA